jgi:hypothetical protein
MSDCVLGELFRKTVKLVGEWPHLGAPFGGVKGKPKMDDNRQH